MFFDPVWLLFIAPAVLLGLWAQQRVQSAFAQASRIPCKMSGAEAARYVLSRRGSGSRGD